MIVLVLIILLGSYIKAVWKVSGAAEPTYDALTQVCKGKLLPPKNECSKLQRTTGIHFWRDHGKSFLQVENEADYIFILKAKVSTNWEIKNIAAKKYHCSKRSDAINLIWSWFERYISWLKWERNSVFAQT